jgi:hypothetical protein
MNDEKLIKDVIKDTVSSDVVDEMASYPAKKNQINGVYYDYQNDLGDNKPKYTDSTKQREP